MFIGSLLLRRTTSRTLTTTLQARSACLSEWDSTTAASLMAARQFLCSVSVCSAWLPYGESWVAKPRKDFAKGRGGRNRLVRLGCPVRRQIFVTG